jgi:hypothetical protein
MVFRATEGGLYVGSVEDRGCQANMGITTMIEPRPLRPHVVILGAGASRATFPNGDAKGKPIPLMDDLVSVLGLNDLLDRHRVAYDQRNFESVYAEVCSEPAHAEIRALLENALRQYFQELELPAAPTLYDHLLLSLRSKDVVATFNWDPFLADAWNRNSMRTRLPDILHLHGNVRVGCCVEHRERGHILACCPTCGRSFSPTGLLYPVENKDYSGDPFISREWKSLRTYLRDAFTLTIFGYGAPISDKDAVSLMNDAWLGAGKRTIETIEIIDIKQAPMLRSLWSPFIFSQHVLCHTSFYESYLGRYPRRSCEAIYVPTVTGRFPPKSAPLPRAGSFGDLDEWLLPLLDAERSMSSSRY